MTEELKPSDVLDHAANLIDYWGWHRGDLIDAKTGAMCHVGAIGAAAGYNIHRHSKRDGWVVTFRQEGFWSALCAERWDIEAIGRGGIPRWNDCDCQSKDEAVAMLRKAAAMAREAGE